jgi:hypothetical protein
MSARVAHPRRLAALAALALALVALAVALGGCGGSSDATAAETAAPTEIVAATFPTGRDTDEVSASGAKPVPACELVTKPEAEAILGKNVSVSERPLGPTCVYAGSGRRVSLVVEKVPLKALRDGARSATEVTVAGRRGWCVRYETTAVVVSAGEGRVLHVTGPCAAGVRFAAKALPRISK